MIPCCICCLLQLSTSLLDGKELKFYQYDGDVNQLLDAVRSNLNDLADSWTRDQKDHCLKETADAFKVCSDLKPAEPLYMNLYEHDEWLSAVSSYRVSMLFAQAACQSIADNSR